MILARALALACLLALGCRGSTPGGGPGPAPSASAASAPSAAQAPSSPPPAASPPSPRASASAPSAPPGAEELAAIKRYASALGKGRLLTARKDFPSAIRAFDEALSALPHDARALAERGYARLQAGELDGAERDFYEALARSPDPKALSAITYNLALVAERRGNTALAEELKESAKAQRRPAPKASCSYQVRRGKEEQVAPRPEHVLTLREARAKIVAHNTSGGPSLSPELLATNEEEVIKRLLVGEGPPPWKVELGETTHLIAGSPGDYWLTLDAASYHYARCGSTRSLRLDLSPLPSVSSYYFDFGYGLSCPKGELSSEQEVASCSFGCIGPSWSSQQVVVLDPKTLEPQLAIERMDYGVSEDARPEVAFVVKADGVQLIGGGCNAFEPLKKLPAPPGMAHLPGAQRQSRTSGRSSP